MVILADQLLSSITCSAFCISSLCTAGSTPNTFLVFSVRSKMVIKNGWMVVVVRLSSRFPARCPLLLLLLRAGAVARRHNHHRHPFGKELRPSSGSGDANQPNEIILWSGEANKQVNWPN
mgnify:CR=1 FL=1